MRNREIEFMDLIHYSWHFNDDDDDSFSRDKGSI